MKTTTEGNLKYVTGILNFKLDYGLASPSRKAQASLRCADIQPFWGDIL
jgi:hypothetical protein